MPAPYCLTQSVVLCNGPATPVIYTLSLHDALPIYHVCADPTWPIEHLDAGIGHRQVVADVVRDWQYPRRGARRSEEHTSELQSHSDLVCRLLLEKKNML